MKNHPDQNMKLSRQSRSVAALLALASLLFSQLALAWYQCPAAGPAMISQVVAGAAGDTSMLGCDGMDPDQPALCHAHAQVGKQSLDKPDAPAAQPFTAVVLAVVLPIAELNPQSRSFARNEQYLTRDVAPAIAVRNCCFRI